MNTMQINAVLFGTGDTLSRGDWGKSQKTFGCKTLMFRTISPSAQSGSSKSLPEISVLRTVPRVYPTARPRRAMQRTRRHVAVHVAARVWPAERKHAMGGNGTFAAGNVVKYRWETVGKIEGVKVLAPVDSKSSPKLPEEAHSSRMYIKLYGNGKFSQLRIYDKKHRLRFEIAYHPERTLDKSGKPVLHYHTYTHPGFKHGDAKFATKRMIDKFGKYMKGVDLDEARKHT